MVFICVYYVGWGKSKPKQANQILSWITWIVANSAELGELR
jgi:hypothetical protein